MSLRRKDKKYPFRLLYCHKVVSQHSTLPKAVKAQILAGGEAIGYTIEEIKQ